MMSIRLGTDPGSWSCFLDS